VSNLIDGADGTEVQISSSYRVFLMQLVYSSCSESPPQRGFVAIYEA
jgi:hypothetical protein